jgi:integrase
MSTKARKNPAYRLHRPTGQAVVRLDGRDFYLGKHGTDASREAYRRTVAGWLVTPHPGASNTPGPVGLPTPTVNEVILAFWTRHAEAHYRRADGGPTGELRNFRDSLRPLRTTFGQGLAKDFSPLALKAARQVMIDSGLARSTINQRVGRIVRLFKWAASEELVPVSVYLGLKCVSGLSKGRTQAREPAPVQPVADETIEAIMPHVARQVRAMIELQRLTGRRPGEVVIMRACDLDTSGEVWIFTPPAHKTTHLGRERRICLGPRAQDVVRPWLRAVSTEYLFSPKEAMAEFRAEQRRNRTTTLYPSQRARGRKPDPKRRLGARYTVQSYHHAIGYGCRKAGVPPWHPNQLRHSAATTLRKKFGLDAARVILGHSSPAVTEIYAEIDGEKARKVAAEIG